MRRLEAKGLRRPFPKTSFQFLYHFNRTTTHPFGGFMNTKTKTKAQIALVDTASKGVKAAATSSVQDFSHKIARIPDPALAAVISEENAALKFDAQHPELHQVTLLQPELDKRFENSDKQMEELERSVREIPREIKSNAVHAGGDKGKIGFWRWSLMDKMSSILLLPAGLACLVMSSVNVYSNLMSSGDPIYIKNRLIPLFISLLAPSCSIAIKFIGNIFEHNHRSKKRFTNFMFLSSGIAFIAWIALFSAAYSGPVSGVDWEALTEASKGDLGSWLAFTQLLTEILIGGSLFLALQDICLKYSPDYYIDNPAYLAAVKARDAHLVIHNALRDIRNENHTRLTVLKAERQAYINEKLVELINQQARLASLNDL